MSIISENLKKVRYNIEEAAIKSGRNPSDIVLIGVTKTIDVDRINEILECGVTDLGENKVQELMEKQLFVSQDASWHLIGHLQTNKVKNVVGKVSLIHSVDSFKLGNEINKQAAKIGVTANVLIEINIASEESKYGIMPEQAKNLAEELSYLDNISVKGLMTVAPVVEKAEDNKVYFKKMKELFIDIKDKCINNIDMFYLSMGMTADYYAAIEEGANMVRIGTGIFGDRR